MEAFAVIISDAPLPSAGAAGRLHASESWLNQKIPYHWCLSCALMVPWVDLSFAPFPSVCCIFVKGAHQINCLKSFGSQKRKKKKKLAGKFRSFHLDSLDWTISPPSVENHRTKQKLLLTADDQNAPAVCKLGHIWVLFFCFLLFFL